MRACENISNFPIHSSYRKNQRGPLSYKNLFYIVLSNQYTTRINYTKVQLK